MTNSPACQPWPDRGLAAVAAPPAGRLCERQECLQPLTGHQKRFCSGRCRAAWHDQIRPRINAPGVEPACGEGSIKARIKALLADGHQRTGDQIAFELRVGGSTALRELRKLRTEEGEPVSMARLYGPSKPAVYWMPVQA